MRLLLTVIVFLLFSGAAFAQGVQGYYKGMNGDFAVYELMGGRLLNLEFNVLAKYEVCTVGDIEDGQLLATMEDASKTASVHSNGCSISIRFVNKDAVVTAKGDCDGVCKGASIAKYMSGTYSKFSDNVEQ